MKNIIQLSAVAGMAALLVAGCGGGGGNDNNRTQTFIQRERLARPVVNEVFATVANDQHQINNTINPPQDAAELAPDIRSFMKAPAGRSDAITNFVAAVLVPDIMVADLSKNTPAAYLGVETNGATGGTFGGRKLQDDVVDISLGIIFGTTVSDITAQGASPVPPDGNQTPALTSDNVRASKTYLNAFPYLPNPR